MKLDDLKHVFKSSTCAPVDAKSYIVNLLNKFEVALTWDNRTLLIPSLLPSEEQLRTGLPGTDVRVRIFIPSGCVELHFLYLINLFSLVTLTISASTCPSLSMIF